MKRVAPATLHMLAWSLSIPAMGLLLVWIDGKTRFDLSFVRVPYWAAMMTWAIAIFGLHVSFKPFTLAKAAAFVLYAVVIFAAAIVGSYAAYFLSALVTGTLP